MVQRRNKSPPPVQSKEDMENILTEHKIYNMMDNIKPEENEAPEALNNKAENVSTGKNNDDLFLLSKEVFTLSELLQHSTENVPFLLENIIPRYGITFLTGPSDCNKSTFLRQLSFAIGSGNNTFLEIPLHTTYRKAIMVITEDLAKNVSPLVKKQVGNIANNGLGENTRFLFTTVDVYKKLDEMLSTENVDLVAIDTWTDIFGGDLNQANIVRASLQKLNELVKKYGCAIIAIHHTKKGSEEKNPTKDSMLGSMGIQAYARSVIEIRRDAVCSDRRLLTVVKGNYVGDEFKDISYVLELDQATMTLSNSTGVIQQNNKRNPRVYSEEEKEQFIPIIMDMQKQGISQDKIRLHLEEKFPDKKIPSKGTINGWIQEYGKPDSQKDS